MLSSKMRFRAVLLRSYLSTNAGSAARLEFVGGGAFAEPGKVDVSHASISEYVAGALTYWSEAVASCLADAQSAGQLAKAVDAHTLGCYLVDAYEGAVARAKVSNDRAVLDAFMTTTFDVILPSIRLPTKTPAELQRTKS